MLEASKQLQKKRRMDGGSPSSASEAPEAAHPQQAGEDLAVGAGTSLTSADSWDLVPEAPDDLPDLSPSRTAGAAGEDSAAGAASLPIAYDPAAHGSPPGTPVDPQTAGAAEMVGLIRTLDDVQPVSARSLTTEIAMGDRTLGTMTMEESHRAAVYSSFPSVEASSRADPPRRGVLLHPTVFVYSAQRKTNMSVLLMCQIPRVLSYAMIRIWKLSVSGLWPMAGWSEHIFPFAVILGTSESWIPTAVTYRSCPRGPFPSSLIS